MSGLTNERCSVSPAGLRGNSVISIRGYNNVHVCHAFLTWLWAEGLLLKAA